MKCILCSYPAIRRHCFRSLSFNSHTILIIQRGTSAPSVLLDVVSPPSSPLPPPNQTLPLTPPLPAVVQQQHRARRPARAPHLDRRPARQPHGRRQLQHLPQPGRPQVHPRTGHHRRLRRHRPRPHPAARRLHAHGQQAPRCEAGQGRSPDRVDGGAKGWAGCRAVSVVLLME